jgi:hypothetical protein
MKHNDLIASAAFSPDGRRIVTASYDRSARLWDARTGAPLGMPMKHNDLIASAAFSPDGSRIVTASHDHTARLWDIGRSPSYGSGGKLARQVCALLPYNVRDFSATYALRREAQKAFLDPGAPGPCDQYGLASAQYWRKAAVQGWQQIGTWSQDICGDVGLCSGQ